MLTVEMCPVCGHQNAPDSPFCANCRARLAHGNGLPRDDAYELGMRRRTSAKRRRLVRWGLVVLIVLGTVGWIAYQNIGISRFQSPPASDISAVPSPGDWPMSLRGPAHSAIVSDSHAALQGKLKWRFETDAPIFSSPAVVAGRVYLSTGDRRIMALDGESGRSIWEHEVNGPVNSSPAVAGDFVFTGLRDGRVIALDKDTGEFRWGFRSGGMAYSSPLVYQGVLYVGSGDGRLYAIDAMTGEERWSFLTGGKVVSDPAASEGVVAVISQDSYLHLLDADTGRQRLDYLTYFARGSPVFHEGWVYVTDQRGLITAVDWSVKELPFEKVARWLRTQMWAWGFVDTVPPQKGFAWASSLPDDSFVGTPVVTAERIYLGSESGAFYALDRTTGEKAWTFQANAGLTASPSVVGELVLVGDREGRLYALDTLTGEKRWEFETGGRISSTPVFANGVLYLTSQDGSLYAIQ